MIFYGTSTSGTASTANTGWAVSSATFYIRFSVEPPRPVHRCLAHLFSLRHGATKLALARRYRQLAKIAHPDRSPEMGRWMVAVNRIYEMLTAEVQVSRPASQ